MTDKSVYGIDGMTRQEFERDLRSRYSHDNVRARERGISVDLENDEKSIKERVERNYGKANCPGCAAFDVGMSEVNFDQQCTGCQARMRALNGLGPTPRPEYAARFEPIADLAARATPADHSAFALEMLVAGGFVSQEKVDNALKIAAKILGAGDADHSRDSVIEECAAVCDAMANEVEDQRQFALDLCSDAIRALKSQQDAAIESKPAEQPEPDTLPVGKIIANDPVHGWHMQPLIDWEKIGDGTLLYATVDKRPSAWMEYAQHLEHCRQCGETSYLECYDGNRLHDAAHSGESQRSGDGS